MGVRQFDISGDQKLLIHELDDSFDSVTGRPLTGSWVWDSALILSQWIHTHLDFTNKSVLELGSGTGLPGLTAAQLGARRVVLTDIGALVPGMLKNVEANRLGERVEVRELMWGNEESLSQLEELGEFDIVLMSDVFYDADVMVDLGETLRRVCRERSVEVWAASEIRPWTRECLNELVSQGFEVVELPSQLSDDLDMFAILKVIPRSDQEKCNVIETEF
ncbi:hypothetical protein ACFE04_031868 [Oxalis oulophora]